MRGSSPSHRGEDLRHAALGGLANLLNAAGALAVPALHGLIVWAYGPVIYGLYAVGISVAEAGSKLGTLGLDQGLLRQIAAERAVQNHVAVRNTLGTAVFTTSVLSTAMALLTFVLAERVAPFFGSSEFAGAISWLALCIPFISITNVLVASTLAARVVRFNLLVKGAMQPFLLIAFAALMSASPGLPQLTLAQIAALCCSLIVAIWGVTRVFRGECRWEAFSFEWTLLRFSLPLGLADFLNNLMHRASLIILAFFVDAKAVAAYAACDMLVRAIGGIRNAFDPILSPVLSESLKLNDHERVSYNLKLVTRWVVGLMLPVGILFIFFAEEILGLLDPNFKSASLILSILCVAYALNSALGLNGWVLVMDGRSWLVFLNNSLSVAINISLSFWLIPRLGSLGSAIATATAVLAALTLILCEVGYLKKLQPLSWGILRLVLAGGLGVILLTQLSPHLPATPIARMMIGLSAFLIFYLVAWKFVALNHEDRHALEQVRRTVSKLSKGRRTKGEERP